MSPLPEDSQGFRILRRRLFLVTVSLSLLAFVAFALAAYSFKNAHDAASARNAQAAHDRTALCNAQNDANKALRRVLVLARSIHDPRATKDERKRARAFYRQALALVEPLNCAALITTDNGSGALGPLGPITAAVGIILAPLSFTVHVAHHPAPPPGTVQQAAQVAPPTSTAYTSSRAPPAAAKPKSSSGPPVAPPPPPPTTTTAPPPPPPPSPPPPRVDDQGNHKDNGNHSGECVHGHNPHCPPS